MTKHNVPARFVEAAGGKSYQKVVLDGGTLPPEVAVQCETRDGKTRWRVFAFEGVTDMVSDGGIREAPIYVEARDEWR